MALVRLIFNINNKNGSIDWPKCKAQHEKGRRDEKGPYVKRRVGGVSPEKTRGPKKERRTIHVNIEKRTKDKNRCPREQHSTYRRSGLSRAGERYRIRKSIWLDREVWRGEGFFSWHACAVFIARTKKSAIFCRFFFSFFFSSRARTYAVRIVWNMTVRLVAYFPFLSFY